MMLVAVFVLFFVGGPLIFRALTRKDPAPTRLRGLAVLAAGLAVAGLAVRYGLGDRWGQDVVATWAGILLIWFGWIAVLALGAQSLRRDDPGVRMRRWIGVIGALGTTVPWFGLASARMMGG